ncbi:MAG: MgtC/SapB family protein [Halobacteriovoraceae bacterium]|nr:MgtC/SapB family protein [Halobacteriovoraceae bacterium]MCB9095391.1 MgtC/SapB family protein [Halobacteriovoraceae bacterium]
MIELTDKSVFIEFLGPINFYFGLGLKIVSAILLGAIIGLDREKKFKSAGVKTQMMICVGATIYTSISFINIDLHGHGPNIDPNRLAAQIVSGIGFLGAGAIIQSRGSIFGLTTAATIWVVAGIGMTIGSGYIFSAIFFTITILIILNLIEPFLRFIGHESMYHFELLGKTNMVKEIDDLIHDLAIDQVESEIFRSHDSDSRCSYHLAVRGNNKELKKLIHYLRTHDDIESFTHKIVRRSK